MGHIAGKENVYDRVHVLSEHVHSEQNVYPTLAAGVQVTATNAGTTWTLGTLVEVIPASTITQDFDIHHVGIEDVSDNTIYELVLYAGSGDTEIGRARVSREGGADGALRNIPMMTPIIEKNSRIRAAIATPDDDGEDITISLFYHVY